MKKDIKVLEDMRDNIYGAMQFEDDYQVSDLEEKQFNALNLAIKHLRKTKLVKNNYIPKSKIREKIEEYEQDVKDFEEYWSRDPRRFKRQQSVDYYKLEVLKELLQEGDK